MITIKVGGTPLYIPKDTTLVLEQHNNSFDIDNITSDVIWTFDLPAKPNARALNQAHYINISNHKRYRCEISFAGVVVSNGYLFVQSVVDEKTISCGVVLDGLGEEFGNRKLKENDYGDDVVISQPTDSLEQHRTNWYNFLTGSLNANSIYKFFLFCCERFYKNNEAYGYHQNQWSTLPNRHDEKNWAKFVNRLFTFKSSIFFDTEHVTNSADNVDDGMKLFNTLGNNTDKLNGYCFCPAIRLDWLVQQVFANAGYRVTGDFLPNAQIKNLFLQSMNAMDGDMTQFGRDEYLYLTGGAVGQDITNAPQYTLDVGVNEVTYNSFKHGSTASTFNFAIRADVDSLTHEQVTSSIYEYVDEVFFLWVAPSDTQISSGFPYTRCCVSSISGAKDFRYGGWPYFSNLRDAAAAAGYPAWGGSAVSIKMRFDDNGRFYGIDNFGNLVNNADYLYNLEAKESLIQLTPSHDNSGASYDDPEQLYDIEGNFLATRFFQMGNATNPFCIRLVKAKVRSTKHTQWTGDWNATPNATMGVNGIGSVPVWIPKAAQLEFLEYEETIEKTDLNNTNTLMNVFDTMLRWKQHVPNVTNGDFIKKICKFFGLSLYINPFHKTVQLSFLNDVFDAGAVDITPYVTNSERMAYDPTQYKITAATVLGKKGTAEDFLMDPVMKRSDLTAARSKKRMQVFVRNENAYNIATQDEKTKKYIWETNAGNDATLTIGNDGDGTEEIETEIQVPNMKVVDTEQVAKYFCDIENSGNSKLMDDDYTGEFDMILQQYKGRRGVLISNIQLGTYRIEDANPTCYDKYGNVSDNYLTLAATGHNSVGEKWLRRFYEFKAEQENYRFTAKLPVEVFLQVYQLQLPQEDNERRWIIVQNRRYIPINISYEFGAGDKVLATIECARRHYDTD